MAIPLRKNLTIIKGKTFEYPIQWETDPIVYKAITAVAQTAPCQLTVPGHGLPASWPVAIICVKGMIELNSENSPPRDSDYVVATKTGTDTIELNAKSCACYKTYTSGGYIQFYTPHTLASYHARMSIKDKVGGTELMSLTDANLRILINDTDKIIKLDLDAEDTEAITWTSGVYDLELVSPSGVVTALLYGSVTVQEEITT